MCKEHAHCEVKEGKAQCLCKDVRECPQTAAPVCGHDNKTYINKCYLDVANCLVNDSIDEQKTGKCGKFQIYFSFIFRPFGCHMIRVDSSKPTQRRVRPRETWTLS